MPTRHEVVQRLLDLMSSNLDVTEAERQWFCDVRRRGGWRLTLAGLAAFDMAGIQRWSVPLDMSKLHRRQLVDMNRSMKWPYYISVKPPSLWLFNDKDAVMAHLHGDVLSWINSLG